MIIYNDTIAVNARSIDDYRFIMHKLAEKRFDHYLMRNIEEIKTRRFVIRGLPLLIEPSDIISELNQKGVGIIEVKSMRCRKNKSLLPLFLISIDKDKH